MGSLIKEISQMYIHKQRNNRLSISFYRQFTERLPIFSIINPSNKHYYSPSSLFHPYLRYCILFNSLHITSSSILLDPQATPPILNLSNNRSRICPSNIINFRQFNSIIFRVPNIIINLSSSCNQYVDILCV